MSRFDEFNYDKEKWELFTKERLDKRFSDDLGHVTIYCLRNLSTSEEYELSSDVQYVKCVADNTYVTGIEQISDHEFIEYSHHCNDYLLCRYDFNKKGILNSKCYDSSGFISLTDDKIWLKDWQIYSISEDCILKTLKPFACTNTEMSLKVNSDRKNFIYCKMPLPSRVDGTDYLLFLFDAETLSPALPVFSSLRNSFIELSDDFTFADLIEEEKKYKEYISSYIESFGKDSALKAEQLLLSSLVDKA